MKYLGVVVILMMSTKYSLSQNSLASTGKISFCVEQYDVKIKKRTAPNFVFKIQNDSLADLVVPELLVPNFDGTGEDIEFRVFYCDKDTVKYPDSTGDLSVLLKPRIKTAYNGLLKLGNGTHYSMTLPITLDNPGLYAIEFTFNPQNFDKRLGPVSTKRVFVEVED